MQREIDSIYQLLKAQTTNILSPLYGIKRVFRGDPVTINKIELPAITIQPANTRYDRRGSRYDGKLRDMLVTLVYNREEYFNKKRGNALNITTASFASSKITFNVTGHSLAINDEIIIQGVTPDGYNGSYKVTDTPTIDSFKVAKTTNPGTYSTGGTMQEITNDKVYAIYESIDRVEKMDENRQTSNLSIAGIIENNPQLPYTEGGVVKYASSDCYIENVRYAFKSDRGFLTWEIICYVKAYTIGDR